MSILHAPTSLPLPSGHWLSADQTDTRLSLVPEWQPLIQLRLQHGVGFHLALQHPEQEPGARALWAACYWMFARDAACQCLTWTLRHSPEEALRSGLLIPGAAAGEYRCERTLFWQLPQPWLGESFSAAYPQQLVITDGKRHPLRPPKPQGEVYRRFDARLGAWVSLRTVEVEGDVERFSRWQNNPRVLAFWQEGSNLQQHREYLNKLEADPRTLTLIGCFDDEPRRIGPKKTASRLFMTPQTMIAAFICWSVKSTIGAHTSGELAVRTGALPLPGRLPHRARGRRAACRQSTHDRAYAESVLSL